MWLICVVFCCNLVDFAMTKADQGTKTTAPDTKTADAGIKTTKFEKVVRRNLTLYHFPLLCSSF